MGPGRFGPPPSEMNEKLKEPLPKRLREVPGYLKRVSKSFFSRLGYIVKLVWEAKKSLLLLMIFMALFNGVSPVISAYISANLLNRIAEVLTMESPAFAAFAAVLLPAMLLISLYSMYRLHAAHQEITRMTDEILALASGTEDRALLLDCRASLEKNPERAIKLIKEALELLPEINEQNALLVSNLNANIGGLYRMTKKHHLAKRYMEAGVEILKRYNLIGYHDSMVQVVNYAVLLNDMGDPEHGLIGLYNLESQFREVDALSGDYALLQQTLGALNINAGHPDKGVEHLKNALAIFNELYADEEELLAEKQTEIRNILSVVGLPLSRVQALS